VIFKAMCNGRPCEVKNISKDKIDVTILGQPTQVNKKTITLLKGGLCNPETKTRYIINDRVIRYDGKIGKFYDYGSNKKLLKHCSIHFIDDATNEDYKRYPQIVDEDVYRYFVEKD